MAGVQSLGSYLKYFNHIHVIFYKSFEEKSQQEISTAIGHTANQPT